MNRRNALALACLVVALVGFYLYDLASTTDSGLGKFPLLIAFFNVIIIASLFGVISPWRRVVVRLAVLDVIVALVLTFLYVARAPLHFGGFGIPNFEKDGLSKNAIYVAIILAFITKSSLSWRYHDELKNQGAPNNADQVPGLVGNFVIVSRIFAGMAAIGIAFFFTKIFGGLKIPQNSDEWLAYGIFIGLPFALGMFGIWHGTRSFLNRV
jgi:hypothetical protein